MQRISTASVVCGCLSLFAYGCQPYTAEGPTGGNGQRSLTPGASGGGTASTADSGGNGGGVGGSAGDVGSAGATGTDRGGAAGGIPNGGRAGSSAGGSAGGGDTGAFDSGVAGRDAWVDSRMGGSSGKGGAAGTGGSSGMGGVPGTGGASGKGGSSTTCTFTQSSATSSAIPTVGIVTWSTTLADVKSAKIDFGLTTSYGFSAPVDLSQKDRRTLLLGMKPGKTYHYRIVASGSDGDCTSPDYTIATGTLPNGLPTIGVSPRSANGLYGGFLVTGQYLAISGGKGSPAYILDADGEIVWAYTIQAGLSSARMSYAGTHMWINSVNVPNGSLALHRVSMDGLVDEDLSSKLAGLNHQLTVLPDETVAFYAYGANGCDDIKEYTPGTGTVRTVVNSGTAQSGANPCHINDIQYSKDDDTLVFSDLTNQAVVKVRRADGATVWILNGSKATFTGDGWKGGQHGIHLLSPSRLLIFDNNSRFFASFLGAADGDGSGSIAMEFSLDLSAKKITRVWQYQANPGIDNVIMGDVQRLPNGNTAVGYSTKGVLHEVDANGTLLQELTWKNMTQFGYIEKRASLYGPPPR
jgi:hypothetical protein